MEIPFNYQISEYDCVPITFLNALNYLFERKEIPPEVLKTIMLYSLDTFDKKGEAGKRGTTGFAVKFICEWLNNYSEAKDFQVSCDYLTEKEADILENNDILECIMDGGVVLASVYMNADIRRYILITDITKDYIFFFDPYYRKRKYKEKDIEIINDEPSKMNRKTTLERVNSYSEKLYSLGKTDNRECVLMYRR
ncbi:MAG: hypothetical protein WA125_11750 [Desulfosporosinus sp.]